jgi:hypothetical protein
VFPIARHLTALNRQSLSAPIQILNRFGFLNNGPTIFDYGCGRGDDVRGLNEAKVPAKGWDPYFASQAAIESADIVNLGFVINVIEDPVERREALLKAYDVARMLLVVSTMIASDEAVTGTPFGDGVLTKRRTFQKYYTQPELLHYVEHILKEPPIPVAPGICFIFRDKKAEQRFQVGRHRSRLRMRPIRPRLQRDVRTFFGSYASALTQAQGLLTKAADPKEIDKASLIAAERGIGWFQLGKSLELHSSLVERLPPVLRVYVNCAAVLYGDLSQVDVIKIHRDHNRSCRSSRTRNNASLISKMPTSLSHAPINSASTGTTPWWFGSLLHGSTNGVSRSLGRPDAVSDMKNPPSV